MAAILSATIAMTTPPENPRLRWLLRRGMKELDVVVTRYYERHFATASDTGRLNSLRLVPYAPKASSN